MVRNLKQVNDLPCSPIRSWRNKIGPREEKRMINAIATIIGTSAGAAMSKQTKSRALFHMGRGTTSLICRAELLRPFMGNRFRTNVDSALFVLQTRPRPRTGQTSQSCRDLRTTTLAGSVLTSIEWHVNELHSRVPLYPGYEFPVPRTRGSGKSTNSPLKQPYSQHGQDGSLAQEESGVPFTVRSVCSSPIEGGECWSSILALNGMKFAKRAIQWNKSEKISYF